MSAIEQSASVKFCVLLYKSSLETLWMIEEAFGRAAVKKTGLRVAQTFSWWPCECQWRTALRATVNFGKWREHPACAQCCAKWTIEEISGNTVLAQVGISVGSVHSIHHKGQHFVLNMLTLGNKETRVTVCWRRYHYAGWRFWFSSNIIIVSATVKRSERTTIR
jgi:hypothetical protein